MLQKIGFVLMCIGAALADSDCLLVPLAYMTVGAVLFLLGGEDDETDDETA